MRRKIRPGAISSGIPNKSLIWLNDSPKSIDYSVIPRDSHAKFWVGVCHKRYWNLALFVETWRKAQKCHPSWKKEKITTNHVTRSALLFPSWNAENLAGQSFSEYVTGRFLKEWANVVRKSPSYLRITKESQCQKAPKSLSQIAYPKSLLKQVWNPWGHVITVLAQGNAGLEADLITVMSQ